MATVKFPSEMAPATSIGGNDKLMISKEATGEAYQATFNQAKEYLNITGIELEPLVGGDTSGTALVVSPGPSGEQRTAEVASGKYYDFGSGPQLADADKRWKAYWSGSSWSLKDMGALPIQEGTETLQSEAIPKGIAVERYVEPIFNSVEGYKSGKNRFNPVNLKNNQYFRTSDNTIQDNSPEAITVKGWVVDEFELGKTYTYSGFATGTSGGSFYLDASNNFIASTNWTAPTTDTRRFTVPNNPLIKKIWFNVPKNGSNDATLQLEEGTAKTAYEPYKKEAILSGKNIDYTGSTIKTDVDNATSAANDAQTAINGIAEQGNDELTEVYEARTTAGYFNSSGVFVSSANWRCTPPMHGNAGDPGVYKGYAIDPVCPVVWFDENMLNPTPLLTNINNAEASFTFPANGYIVASYKAVAGDTQSLKLLRPSYKLKPSAFSVDSVGFMPKKLWGQVGQEFRMYPCGIVLMMSDDTHLDFIWSIPNGNRDFVPVNPTTTADVNISASYRDGLGGVNFIGSTTLKVTKTVPTNPIAKRYILCLGDSLTNAGRWVAEFYLRLTGVNTFISPAVPFGNAVNNITPLGLTNFEFIGKKVSPNASVPREGNGGWAYKNWLNNQNFGVDTNRFWNPATSKFDLNYYLSTEGYSGIDSTGSNLTIYTMCLWNSVYSESLESAIANMDAVFQIIHSQRPGVKIKMMGLNTPPAKFIKPERGGETPNTVMRSIIEYNKALQDYADANSSWVEFICISPQFHPEGSYPNANKALHLRASDIQENYATDHVHPSDRGYAQIADAAYYNCIYNYCNA